MDLNDGRNTDKRRKHYNYWTYNLKTMKEMQEIVITHDKISELKFWNPATKTKNLSVFISSSYLKASHSLRHHGHGTFNGSHQSTDHILRKQLGTVGHEATHGYRGKEQECWSELCLLTLQSMCRCTRRCGSLPHSAPARPSRVTCQVKESPLAFSASSSFWERGNTFLHSSSILGRW